MPSNRFLERLQSQPVLILDGATGTNLQRRGLPVGRPSDLWVQDNPDAVTGLHLDFLQAGADIILTDTFGSSRVNLEHQGLGERFTQNNQQAVALARQAAAQVARPPGSEPLVGGSLGPLGIMLQPYGELEEQDAERAYADQARLLAEAGVDLLVIETQFDLNEAQAALRGVQSVTDLPVVVSFSYDRGTRSMMGVRPAQAGEALAESGVAALGINCGRSLADNLEALRELRGVTGLPIWFKPNAGLPHAGADGGMLYDVTPEMMAAQVPQWIEAGARLVGGCCGTSPEHLRAIAAAARGLG